MRQEERRAKTLNALAIAAKGAFARGGYAETSLDRIAADAGVSKGAVYAYYPTKLDLFLAVTDEVLEDARRRVGRVSRAVAQGEASHRAARRYLGIADDNEHVALMAEVWRMSGLEEAVRERLDAFRHERRADLGAKAVDAGSTARRALSEADVVAKLIDAETLDHRLGLAANA
ncbi:MAG: helix-turn-helix domain-containing protein [Dehalococcoidia bacterium]